MDKFSFTINCDGDEDTQPTITVKEDPAGLYTNADINRVKDLVHKWWMSGNSCKGVIEFVAECMMEEMK